MRSRPISRVLLRRAFARYDRHSSRPAVADGLEPPTRGLGEQRRRPPIWRCSGWRLPRFTRSRKGSDSSLWPCSSPSPRPRGRGYCGRALPGILLCGARTFLSPGIIPGAATIWPASQRDYTAAPRHAPLSAGALELRRGAQRRRMRDEVKQRRASADPRLRTAARSFRRRTEVFRARASFRAPA
jgi:hypothetical protein